MAICVMTFGFSRLSIGLTSRATSAFSATQFLVNHKCLLSSSFKQSESPLPPPPKRPLSAYMLFVKEKRPEVVQQYTDLKITEQVKVIAKQWNELDPSLKEFYVEQARKNFVEYLKTHQDYISSLTPEERETMKRNKVDKKKKLDKRRLKTKLRKLEKPKGPRGPFSLYVSSCMLERRNAPIVQYVKGMSEYWNSMSEEDKEIFYKQAKADKERYLTEMNDWEARMRQEGREDILEELHNLRKKSHVSRKIGSKQGENKKNAQLEEKSGKSTSKITSSDYAGDFFTDGEKTEGKKMSKN